MKLLGPILIGGGVAALGALLLASREKSELEEQVAAPPVALPPTAEIVARLPTFKARLTGYYPFIANLTAKERKMEGGVNDRTGRPLIAIEQHLMDPVRYPYVSVSGDPEIFPYGQRIIIDAWPNAIFRVVDTGDNFSGAKKVYRIAGYEPLDICQLTSDFKKPTTASAKIVPGDWFEGKTKRTVQEIALSKFKGQTVAGAYLTSIDVLGAEEM